MTKGKQGIKNNIDEELADIEDEAADDNVILVRTLRHLRWYSELQKEKVS